MPKVVFIVVVSVLFFTQLYAQNIDSGLVVHYPFENHLEDTVSDLDGNSINGTVSYVPGVSGMALQMPNIITPANDNHRIEVTPWQPGDSSFTVSGWIHIEESEIGVAIRTAPLLTYQDGGFRFSHGFQHAVVDRGNREIVAYLRASSTDHYLSVNCFSYSRWVHSAFTVNRITGILTLFVDGIEVASSNFNETVMPTKGFIGSYDADIARNGHPRYVTSGARLDEIRVYNRALSPEEIRLLYTTDGGTVTPRVAPLAHLTTDATTSSFTAYWTDTLTSDSYLIDIATNRTFTNNYVSQNISTTDTFHLVTGLTPATAYYYRVRSLTTCGDTSVYSNVIRVQTNANPTCAIRFADTPTLITEITGSSTSQHYMFFNVQENTGNIAYTIGANGGTGTGFDRLVFIPKMGSSTFGTPVLVRSGLSGANSPLILDFNNDGYDDIVASTEDNGGSGKGFWWFTNNQSNSFTQTSNYSVSPDVTLTHLIDLENDGDLDIIGVGSAPLYFFENNSGLFTRGINNTITRSWLTLLISDFTGDGFEDIISYEDPNLVLYENQRNGTFLTGRPISTISSLEGYAISDVDQDGDPDIVGVSNDSVFLLINNGLGVLDRLAIHNFRTTMDIEAIEMADFNGNGFEDLIIFNALDSTILALENRNGVFATTTSVLIDLNIFPLINGAFNGRHLQTHDVDQDGDLDLVLGSLSTPYRIVWYENLSVIMPPVTNAISATICTGDSYAFGSQNLTSSGTYSETFIAANGCDSVVSLNLVVLSVLTNTISANICAGDSYILGTQTLITSGTYSETFIAANGCDSVVSLNLVVLSVLTNTISANICSGQSYAFGSQTLTTSGVYSEIFTASGGCDSVVVVTLNVLQEITNTISETICSGQSYAFGSQNLTTSGTYSETFIALNGCDSVVNLTLTVTVLPEITNTISVTICSGQSYAFGSQNLTTSGVYSEIFTASGGCDSVVVVTLNVLQEITNTISETICSGQSYAFGSQNLTTSGTYSETFASNNCDSTVILNLSVLETVQKEIVDTICSDSSYLFGNEIITSSGTYTQSQRYENNSCNSILTTLRLEVVECVPPVPCLTHQDVQNFISPDDDGANDNWVIKGLSDFPNTEVTIYSNWGNVVYQKSNYQNDWKCVDHGGKKVPAGNYIYVVKPNKGDCPILNGTLTVQY